MGRRTTINDVAAAAGVSVSTVSKAVHGRYGVSPETVRRVIDIVEKLGYQSSLGASSMRSQRTGVIGVLVPGFEPFSAEILKGVGSAVRGTGFDLLAYSGSEDGSGDGWERRSVSRLSGTLVDGLIMVTPSVVSVSGEVPVVAIDPHTGRADLPTVESDSYHGAQLATRYLIGLGHTRIGFVAGRPDLRSSGLRDAGYRSALIEAGLQFDPSLVGIGRYEVDATRQLAFEMLSRADRPTAIFAANDLSAIAVAAVASELGISVPDQLSIIGFDDIAEASRHSPPLSTVRQPMQLLGEIAASMLFALLKGEKPEVTHVQLPTRLVPRGTTSPPR
ncbi:LacI family DNA-binding transcriptional regulator [Marisediminicola sp. LYQ134]|uniref:LacI family DNA-binding transcriptional regulator n=1 Tax=unclassified Marisediminicola TaxID=2618316 RepID=UPI0039830F03